MKGRFLATTRKFKHNVFLRRVLSNKIVSWIYYDFLNKKTEGFYQVPDGLTSLEFMQTLENKKIKHALLRWSEDIDTIDDLDILIFPDNFNSIRKLAKYSRTHNGVIVDLATTDGSELYGVKEPAYPVLLSCKWLNNSFVNKIGIRILSDNDQFDALIYHVLFHKGFKTEIPLTPSNEEWRNNKYMNELNRISNKLNINIENSLEGLLELADNRKITPSIDTLEKIARSNPFVEYILSKKGGDIDIKYNLLGCFILRDITFQDLESIFRDFIEKNCIKIIINKKLSNSEKALFSSRSRGGVWPDRDGGGPSSVIFFIPDSSRIKNINDFDFQANLKNLKFLIRNKVNNNARIFTKSALHSADTSLVANSYLSLLDDT
jgi:hypothetical protein